MEHQAATDATTPPRGYTGWSACLRAWKLCHACALQGCYVICDHVSICRCVSVCVCVRPRDRLDTIVVWMEGKNETSDNSGNVQGGGGGAAAGGRGGRGVSHRIHRGTTPVSFSGSQQRRIWSEQTALRADKTLCTELNKLYSIIIVPVCFIHFMLAV